MKKNYNYMDLINKREMHFFFIFVIFITLRFWLISHFNFLSTTEEDAVTRLAISQDYYLKYSAFSIPSMGWLPGHAYLLSIPMFARVAPTISGQYLTLAMSLLSIAIYYLLICNLFNSSLAFFSTMILSTMPIHVLYSIIPMSEIPNLLFVLSAFLFLQKYFSSRKTTFLFASSFSIVLATSIRYESWILACIVLPVWHFLVERKIGRSIFFLMMNFLFVSIYITLSLIMFHKVVYGASINHHFANTSLLWKLNSMNFVWNFFIELGLASLIVIFFSILSYQNYKKNYFFILGIAIVFLNIALISVHELLPFSRFFLLPAALLIPFGIDSLKKYSYSFTVTLILVAFNVFQLPSIIKHSTNDSLLSSGVIETAQWVKQNVSSKSDLLLFTNVINQEVFLLASYRQRRNTFFLQENISKLNFDNFSQNFYFVLKNAKNEERKKIIEVLKRRVFTEEVFKVKEIVVLKITKNRSIKQSYRVTY